MTGPVLDAENTPTKSVPVTFDDVLMTGATFGPDELPGSLQGAVAHRRRDSILGWVAGVIGAAVLVEAAVVVALTVGGVL